jgi:dTDP-4-amino-4,6-dideoxygalactose transaminase
MTADGLPMAESLSSRLLRLPIYSPLTDDEQDYVIETMKEFCEQ